MTRRKPEEAQESFTQKVVTFNDGPVIIITIYSNSVCSLQVVTKTEQGCYVGLYWVLF